MIQKPIRLCLAQILKCKTGALLIIAICCKSFSAMILGCIFNRKTETQHVFLIKGCFQSIFIFQIFCRKSNKVSSHFWPYPISRWRKWTIRLCEGRQWLGSTRGSNGTTGELYEIDLDDRAAAAKHFRSSSQNQRFMVNFGGLQSFLVDGLLQRAYSKTALLDFESLGFLSRDGCLASNSWCFKLVRTSSMLKQIQKWEFKVNQGRPCRVSSKVGKGETEGKTTCYQVW